jgi:ectoine hydroxylase-related dioxygenase (phytanoyl-CoA dioxygenase family)
MLTSYGFAIWVKKQEDYSMPFQYSDQHRIEYFTTGLTVLRGVIPASLLADLRRETDGAREIARQNSGPQSQRLQPVYKYEELKHRPFRDFLELPGLRATVEGILGVSHRESDNMGVLLEPAQHAWCTNWHRDVAHHIAELDMQSFQKAARDLRMFNQFNAALYDDHSLWMVPGSHNREDTPEERACFPTETPEAPQLSEGVSPEERERTCLEYAYRMPGGVPVVLFAGDCAFYRASGWHLGNYVPYTKRATLHDNFQGDEDRAWWDNVRQAQRAAEM